MLGKTTNPHQQNEVIITKKQKREPAGNDSYVTLARNCNIRTVSFFPITAAAISVEGHKIGEHILNEARQKMTRGLMYRTLFFLSVFFQFCTCVGLKRSR